MTHPCCFRKLLTFTRGRFFDASTLPPLDFRKFSDLPKSTTLQFSGSQQTLTDNQRDAKNTLQGPDGVYKSPSHVWDEASGTFALHEGPQPYTGTTAAITAQLPSLPVNERDVSDTAIKQATFGGRQLHGSFTQRGPVGVTTTHDRQGSATDYQGVPAIQSYLSTSEAPIQIFPASLEDAHALPTPKPQGVLSEHTTNDAPATPTSPPGEKERNLDKFDQEQLGQDRRLPMISDEIAETLINAGAIGLRETVSGGTIQQDPLSGQDSTLKIPSNGPAPAGSGEETSPPAANEVGARKLLESQMGAAAAELGFPSTPDEQLRLEEAQSMQLAKASSTISKEYINDRIALQPLQVPASISSQLVQDEQQQVHNMVARPRNDKLIVTHSGAKNEPFGEQDRPMERPTLGLRDQKFPGMTGNLSKDLTFSRRPPMRIDTGVPPTTDSLKSLPNKKTVNPGTSSPYTPLTSTTSQKPTPSSAQAQSPPERMTTRVSSGALRHKSVSEILGETPKSAASQGDKGSLERAINDAQRQDSILYTPRSALMNISPDPAAFKLRLNELKEKERSKLSTVVFARQQSSSVLRYSESAQAQHSESSSLVLGQKDYLLPLFAAQAATPPQSQPLHGLIASAHKTLTTSNHYTDFHEQQDCRMLNKIYQLQYSNRWSLRQPERSVEPDRPTTHWDLLLSQAKWMRTDFREERKWKLTAAKIMADCCSIWLASSAEDRIYMQVRVKRSSAKAESGPLSVLTPELIDSAEDDSSDITEDDSSRYNVLHGNAPAAIFSLAPDMFVFGLDKTPATGKLLLELPLYQPSADIQDAVLRSKDFAPDSAWKKPLVPLSKFAESKMITHEQGPAHKKSRYTYQDSGDVDQDQMDGIFPTSGQASNMLAPEQDDVALFDPENKHIRDRIHAGHAFRPPSEYIMPSQSFFESRQSSQWTQVEDDELRRLVREYAYNWSLISSCLSSPSIFSSGAERRTPWECFERWIGLEGLPAEMSKTQYFRAYHSRLQAAQRTHEAQQQAVQQHQGHSTPHMPMRRRTTQPYLVDRRKNVKHLHLVDAMRKLAKKRETAAHKQQHGI